MARYDGKKVAVIGASYLQLPLIEKVKELGAEAHVFAWAANDVGEEAATCFYPISIVELDRILSKCQEIGIDAICTIGSDLAAVTVNYVAQKMGLVGNPWELTERMTNKHAMREAFAAGGDPSPRSYLVDNATDFASLELTYPAIVKPTDRSGSRGVSKIWSASEAAEAVQVASDLSFEHKAVLEEYVTGHEYSVECIVYDGEPEVLTITQKFTTGDPHYIETGHIEPANLDARTWSRVEHVVKHALGSLGVQNSAGHAEVMINEEGEPWLIEIGARMGGDYIGSHLVYLSTGIDYVAAVVDVAFGNKPNTTKADVQRAAGVRFILSAHDLEVYRTALEDPEVKIVEAVLPKSDIDPDAVEDSSTRSGCFVMVADSRTAIERYVY